VAVEVGLHDRLEITQQRHGGSGFGCHITSQVG
jgi:hypothetical protein